jgi:hypothetical protein
MACVPQDLLDAARCFVCLSPTQAQVIRIRLLCAIATSTPMAACDPNTLLEAANCLMCLSPGQLQAIEISLLCQIAGGSGGGGGTGITCGIVDPVAAPTGSCGLYYRTDNGGVWYWSGAAWVQLIAP